MWLVTLTWGVWLYVLPSWLFAGSHNDMVYALGLGLVPEQFVQPVLAALLHSLDGNNTFVVDAFGVWLLPQLVELGAGEAVMDWMLSEAYPSYGFFVRNNIVNATTMMEHWDTPMENDSHNHAWLNSVALFYRTRLLGIVPQTPGWETTRIRFVRATAAWEAVCCRR